MKTAPAFRYDGFTGSPGRHQKGMWQPAHSFIFPIEKEKILEVTNHDKQFF